MYAVTLHLPGQPSPRRILELLDIGAEATANWYLAEWKAGKNPPASAVSAGLRYVPKQNAAHQDYFAGPEAFRRGEASCDEAAMILVGHARALARAEGMSPGQARRMYLIAMDWRKGSRRGHVWFDGPEGRIDPIEGMKR